MYEYFWYCTCGIPLIYNHQIQSEGEGTDDTELLLGFFMVTTIIIWMCRYVMISVIQLNIYVQHNLQHKIFQHIPVFWQIKRL